MLVTAYKHTPRTIFKTNHENTFHGHKSKFSHRNHTCASSQRHGSHFFSQGKTNEKRWKKKRENERQAQAFHKLNDSIGMYEASIL